MLDIPVILVIPVKPVMLAVPHVNIVLHFSELVQLYIPVEWGSGEI